MSLGPSAHPANDGDSLPHSRLSGTAALPSPCVTPVRERGQAAVKMRSKTLLASASAAALLTLAACGGSGASASEDGDIILGLPLAQTADIGVSDHKDFLNGVQMAVDEINADGGVDGRKVKIETVDTDPVDAESITSAFTSIADKNVHAILSPFTFIPQAAMDAAAAYGAPYMNGDTQSGALDVYQSDPEKYRNAFMLDGPEVYYGKAFAPYLDQLEAQGWQPKNNRVHIVPCEIGYCQAIEKSAVQAIEQSDGKWELGEVTQITSPVQDWGAVVSALHKEDAGVIIIDHWVASELAAFAKAWAANPVDGSLVYLQYGPSQPEFLQLAGEAGNGFVWSSMTALRNTDAGAAFRQKYGEEFQSSIGLLYSGMGYDAVEMLKKVWETNGSTDFERAVDELRDIQYDGVLGHYAFNPDTQAAMMYPWDTEDPAEGLPMTWLQIQHGESKIVAPEDAAETTFRPGATSWMS